MTPIAHKVGRVFAIGCNPSKWPDQLQIVFPRVSRGEIIMAMIIGGLIIVIACVVIRVVPQLVLTKVVF